MKEVTILNIIIIFLSLSLMVLNVIMIFLSLSLMTDDINLHKQIKKIEKENMLLQIKCKGIK